MLLIYFGSHGFIALLMLAAILVLGAILGIMAHRHRAQGGNEELPGMTGEVTEPSDVRGHARALVRGEVWQVRAGGALKEGDLVRVKAVRGLWLEVVRVKNGA